MIRVFLTSSALLALAGTASDFARRCLDLLDSPESRRSMSEAASRIVAGKYSWDSVTAQFERLLLADPS